jgi:DNA-directed RNA polymerase specialized sigma24 family protein
LDKLPADVRKHVAAIHVGGSLGLVERKLINVLLLNAFDHLSEDNRTHTIAVPLLLETMDWGGSKNIEHLRAALTTLATTPIIFDRLKDGKGKWSVMTALSFAEIANGVCSYRYDKGLSQQLADPAMYAKININIQNQFDSAYALALYENCYRFHKVGGPRPIGLDVWRELLGAQAPVYNEFKYLSQRVLTPAIKRVNAVSNIDIEMVVIRENRKVVALKFKVTEKAQKSINDMPGDPDDVIRETEAFALLSKCDIGARLAIQWIRDDPQKALRVAKETLARDAKQQIKSSRAGYARASFENGDVTDVPDTTGDETAPPKLPHEHPDEREKDRRADAARRAAAALTDEQRAALRAAYIAAHPGAAFSTETGKWNSAAHTTGYRAFERAQNNAR